MKYLGSIIDDKDIINKEYLEAQIKKSMESMQLVLGSVDGILCKQEQGKQIIPVATNTDLGVVKGSSNILIESDGSISVNSVEISKVFVPEGDTVIFDGGNSII